MVVIWVRMVLVGIFISGYIWDLEGLGVYRGGIKVNIYFFLYKYLFFVYFFFK